MPSVIPLAIYPGLDKIIKANFTFSAHGVTPSAAVIEIAPQAEFPAPVGDLVFTFRDVDIPFRDCKVNVASFARNSRGLIWALQILDRRWKWAEHTISGSYNVRLEDETVDMDTEKTPRELATMLLKAMGEVAFDVSVLPNDTRPLVEWAYENCGRALEQLCDSLGCRVVLQLNGRVKICRLGEGAELPDLPAMSDDSGSLDPPEVPDRLRVVFGPTQLQALMICRAVGQDTNGEIKPIDNLSFRPAGGWSTSIPGRYLNLSDVDPTGAGNINNSPRKLAERTVWRWYQAAGMLDPQFETKVRPKLGAWFDFRFDDIKQFLPLYAQTIDIDPATGRNAEPRVQGVFAKMDGIWGNAAAWTHYTQGFSVVPDKGIVDFSDYVFKWNIPGSGATATATAGGGAITSVTVTNGGSGYTYGAFVFFKGGGGRGAQANVTVQNGSVILVTVTTGGTGYSSAPTVKIYPYMVPLEPEIYLVIAFPVKHQTTREQHRVWREIDLGGNNGTGAKIIRVEEIGGMIRAEYNADGKITSWTTNDDEMNAEADFQLKAALASYQAKATQERSYAGLVPINPDGAIQQLTLSAVEGQGCTTRASRNNEYHLAIPNYTERQRIAWAAAAQQQLAVRELQRRQQLQGGAR